MDDLVVAALDEGGVDGAERHQPFACQTSCKRDSVLLCDADIKHAIREGLQMIMRTEKECEKRAARRPPKTPTARSLPPHLLKPVHPSPAAHGSVNSDDAGITLRLSHQCVRKVVGVGLGLQREEDKGRQTWREEIVEAEKRQISGVRAPNMNKNLFKRKGPAESLYGQRN